MWKFDEKEKRAYFKGFVSGMLSIVAIQLCSRLGRYLVELIGGWFN